MPKSRAPPGRKLEGMSSQDDARPWPSPSASTPGFARMAKPPPHPTAAPGGPRRHELGAIGRRAHRKLRLEERPALLREEGLAHRLPRGAASCERGRVAGAEGATEDLPSLCPLCARRNMHPLSRINSAAQDAKGLKNNAVGEAKRQTPSADHALIPTR